MYLYSVIAQQQEDYKKQQQREKEIKTQPRVNKVVECCILM